MQFAATYDASNYTNLAPYLKANTTNGRQCDAIVPWTTCHIDATKPLRQPHNFHLNFMSKSGDNYPKDVFGMANTQFEALFPYTTTCNGQNPNSQNYKPAQWELYKMK